MLEILCLLLAANLDGYNSAGFVTAKGSAVVIEGGYALTASHCISLGLDYKVDGVDVEVLKAVDDVVLLKFKGEYKGKMYRIAPKEYTYGATCRAAGRVSGDRDMLPIQRVGGIVFMSGTNRPGDSGGGLFADGKVVGICSSQYVDSNDKIWWNLGGRNEMVRLKSICCYSDISVIHSCLEKNHAN